MDWKNIILNNFWPKIISLILAVATWFYVFDMVNSDSFSQRKATVEEVVSRYDFIVKEIPVKLVFSGKSPKGYKVLFDEIKVTPSNMAVFGPKEIIAGVKELETDKIFLGEYTRSAKLRLGLHSDVKYLQIKDKVVDVYLPVEPVKAKKAEEEK